MRDEKTVAAERLHAGDVHGQLVCALRQVKRVLAVGSARRFDTIAGLRVCRLDPGAGKGLPLQIGHTSGDAAEGGGRRRVAVDRQQADRERGAQPQRVLHASATFNYRA